MKKTKLLSSYEGATRVLAPALPLWLSFRAKKGKEDPERLDERNGLSLIDRPDGFVVWMHAASVGESQMLMPLINRITREIPRVNIVVTTGTVTSAQLLETVLPPRAVHQYAPADHPNAVNNFLNHWQPDLAMFAESELWPNMILGLKSRAIPHVLINARMSKESIERWGKNAKGSAKVLLDSFDLILAANTETANGLSWLTGRDIESAGNLKDAAPVLDSDPQDLQDFQSAIGERPVWCAASTHDGEEELVCDAMPLVREANPNSLLLLAPRHPERIDAVEAIFKKNQYKTQRRSDGRAPDKDTDVYIFDTIGDLGLVYHFSTVAFIGGSLIKGLKGHNPLEAARLENAIITGPQISSFADTYMALLAFDGVVRILDPKNLGKTIVGLFADPDQRNALTQSAKTFAQSRDAVLDFVWAELSPYLPESAA